MSRMEMEGWVLGLLIGIAALAVGALGFRLAIGRARADAAAAQLQRTTATLEEIIGTAPAGFLFLDDEHRIVRMNPAMAGVLGCVADEQIGRRAEEVFDDPVGREVAAAIDRVLATGRAVIDRRLTLPTSHEDRSVIVSYYPIEWGDVTVVGAITVDITARERYDRARGRLLEFETSAREHVERAASRLRRLQAITSALSTAPSSKLVAEVIMAEGMKAMEIDAGSLATIKEDLRTLHIVATDGGDDEVLRRPEEFPLGAPLPIADAARTQRAVYLESGEDLARAYPQLSDEARGGKHGSWAALPLVVSGRTLGAIGAAFSDRRRFDPEQVTFLEAVADQCAAALDRALSDDAMRVLAQTLQRSLLPPALPSVDDVEFAAHFESAGHGMVSGDFYDAFALPVADMWCAAIGDVCGKGARAAAMTSLARHTIRAVAHHDPRPSAVLEGLAEALRGDVEQRDPSIDESFCTSAAVTIRHRDGGLEIELCCGGHPLPLVVRRDGAVEECGRPGTLLGVVPPDELDLTDDVVWLGPGDALLLYTDGLPDAWGPQGFFGHSRMRAAATGAWSSASELVASVVDAARTFSDGVLRDDLAVLVIRAPRPESAERVGNPNAG